MPSRRRGVRSRARDAAGVERARLGPHERARRALPDARCDVPARGEVREATRARRRTQRPRVIISVARPRTRTIQRGVERRKEFDSFTSRRSPYKPPSSLITSANSHYSTPPPRDPSLAVTTAAPPRSTASSPGASASPRREPSSRSRRDRSVLSSRSAPRCPRALTRPRPCPSDTA